MGRPGRPPTITTVSRYTQELLDVLRPTGGGGAGAAHRLEPEGGRGRRRARRRDRSRARGPGDAAREQSVLRLAAPGLEHAPRDGDARLRHRARRSRSAPRAACSTAAPSSGPTASGATRSRPRRAASVIARKVGLSTADAFSAGLLHDLGAVLLHRRDAAAFADATASPTVSDQVAAELAAFGVTHADEGAAALDAWGFPEPFVEAIAMHQHGVEEPQARARPRVARRGSGRARARADAGLSDARPTSTGCLLAIRLRPDDFDDRHPRGRRPTRTHRRHAGSRRVSGAGRPRRDRSPGSTRSRRAAWRGCRMRAPTARCSSSCSKPSCLLELAKIETTRVDPASYLQLAVDVDRADVSRCTASRRRCPCPGAEPLEVHAGEPPAGDRRYPLVGDGVTLGVLVAGELKADLGSPDEFFEQVAAPDRAGLRERDALRAAAARGRDRDRGARRVAAPRRQHRRRAGGARAGAGVVPVGDRGRARHRPRRGRSAAAPALGVLGQRRPSALRRQRHARPRCGRPADRADPVGRRDRRPTSSRCRA